MNTLTGRATTLFENLKRNFFVEGCALVCAGAGAKFLFSGGFPFGVMLLLVPAALALEHYRLKKWGWGFYVVSLYYFAKEITPLMSQSHLRGLVVFLEHCLYYLAFVYIAFLLGLRTYHNRKIRQGELLLPVKCKATLWGY